QTRDGRHRADFVIGADGANSLVRRRVSKPFSREQLSVATGFFVHGRSSDEIVIELTADPPGYIWSFPRPDHLAVGVCAQADVTAQRSLSGALRARTAAWIHAALPDSQRSPADLDPYAWPIPSLGVP